MQVCASQLGSVLLPSASPGMVTVTKHIPFGMDPSARLWVLPGSLYGHRGSVPAPCGCILRSQLESGGFHISAPLAIQGTAVTIQGAVVLPAAPL